MDLIGRIEHGMTTAEDAVLVRRLMAAIVGMMATMPGGMRESLPYRMGEKALADAMEDRRD